MVNYCDYQASAKKIFRNAFGLKEARDRQGITKAQVDLFRKKALEDPRLPKVLIDNQVSKIKCS
jgi:hypothetical protein